MAWPITKMRRGELRRDFIRREKSKIVYSVGELTNQECSGEKLRGFYDALRKELGDPNYEFPDYTNPITLVIPSWPNGGQYGTQVFIRDPSLIAVEYTLDNFFNACHPRNVIKKSQILDMTVRVQRPIRPLVTIINNLLDTHVLIVTEKVVTP